MHVCGVSVEAALPKMLLGNLFVSGKFIYHRRVSGDLIESDSDHIVYKNIG